MSWAVPEIPKSACNSASEGIVVDGFQAAQEIVFWYTLYQLIPAVTLLADEILPKGRCEDMNTVNDHRRGFFS